MESLLQISIGTIGEVWPANFLSSVLTAGMIVAGFKWFMNRFIQENDKKLAANDAKASKALMEIAEIKDNYLDRFEKVNATVVNESRQVAKEVANKLEEINKDKWEHRAKQERQLGSIDSELKQLTNFCRDQLKRGE